MVIYKSKNLNYCLSLMIPNLLRTSPNEQPKQFYDYLFRLVYGFQKRLSVTEVT